MYLSNNGTFVDSNSTVAVEEGRGSHMQKILPRLSNRICDALDIS